MFYRLKEDGTILDSAKFKYAEDCLETEKNIVRGFDGKLVFEEETKTEEYLKAKEIADSQLKKINRIAELKQMLLDTDYKAIKYAEGGLSEAEYSETKTQRQTWRDEINKLEQEWPFI